MLIHLHKQATTTPKVRAAVQNSDDAGTVLAERFGVTRGPELFCNALYFFVCENTFCAQTVSIGRFNQFLGRLLFYGHDLLYLSTKRKFTRVSALNPDAGGLDLCFNSQVK
jgi:hypothetical protein